MSNTQSNIVFTGVMMVLAFTIVSLVVFMSGSAQRHPRGLYANPCGNQGLYCIYLEYENANDPQITKPLSFDEAQQLTLDLTKRIGDNLARKKYRDNDN